MLYPLGWLPPEVSHSNHANSVNDVLPVEQQSHPRWTYLMRGLRATLPTPSIHLPVRGPALSHRFALAQAVPSPDFSSRSNPVSSSLEKILKLGDRNETVKVLQTNLQGRKYYDGPVDGIFGTLTESAVRAFQQDQAIPVDGVVGPLTWARLNSSETNSSRSLSPAGIAVKSALRLRAAPSPQGTAAVAQPEVSKLTGGPVFTPALIPSLSFHPIAISPVEEHPKLVWVTILTLATAGGVAFVFRPDPKTAVSLPSQAAPQLSKTPAVHYPQPVYPKAKSTKTRVVHRPQPVYPVGYDSNDSPSKTVITTSEDNPVERTDRAILNQPVETAGSTFEENPMSTQAVAPALPQDELHQGLSQLFQQSPWATSIQADHLTNFLYDLQEAASRKQLESLVALNAAKDEPEPNAESCTKLNASRSMPLLRRLGTFPDRNRRTGQAYSYMLMDDMGGCFCLQKNELWLTESALIWLNSDEPYTLTIRRVDAAGVTVDKAFTVTLNTYQMQMAS